MKQILTLMLLGVFNLGFCQQLTAEDSLKKEILLIREEVQTIRLNLAKSEKRFRRGMLVSTVGYSVTIAGGLLLGRKQDDLGKALLITGGAVGVTGTVLLVDAFRYLGRAGNSR